ncbi:MAG: hypothetical protein ACRDK0_01395 [Solirubrobacteraceae bacterium]
MKDGGGYCCLGVLCDLAVKDGLDITAEQGLRWWSFGGASAALPAEVVKWAGFTERETYEISDEYDVYLQGGGTQAAELNDEGVLFSRIADLIDDEWPDAPEAGA